MSPQAIPRIPATHPDIHLPTAPPSGLTKLWPPIPHSPTSGFYKISKLGDSRVLSVFGSRVPITAVQPLVRDFSQVWEIVKLGDTERYTIRNVQSNAYAGSEPIPSIGDRVLSQDALQVWQIQPTGGVLPVEIASAIPASFIFAFEITNPLTGFHWSLVDNTSNPVILSDDDFDKNGKFFFEWVEPEFIRHKLVEGRNRILSANAQGNYELKINNNNILISETIPSTDQSALWNIIFNQAQGNGYTIQNLSGTFPFATISKNVANENVVGQSTVYYWSIERTPDKLNFLIAVGGGSGGTLYWALEKDAPDAKVILTPDKNNKLAHWYFQHVTDPLPA